MRFANTAMPETTVITAPKKDPVEKILDDSRDRDVTCTIVYANSANKLFYDEGFTAANAVPAADVFNLFVKGILAVKGGVYYKPTSCTKAGVITFPFPS